MAIDGTKIIESDLGHDVYNEFADLYDAGVEIEKIREKIELWRHQELDDVEFEIFITAYSLALWETGNLDSKILDEVNQTIAKGAGVKMWLAESGTSDSLKRDKELKRFLVKLSIPKKAHRKRKTFKKITNFLFKPNDILSFQMPDKSYRAAILVNVEQIRRDTVYQFAPTSYVNVDQPSESAIHNSSVFMSKVGSGLDRASIRNQQPGIEKYWEIDKQFSMPFTLGLSMEWIQHRDLIKFADKVNAIGQIKIKEGFKKFGSFGYASTFEDFQERFANLIDSRVRIFKNEMIPLAELADVPNSSKLKRIISQFRRDN